MLRIGWFSTGRGSGSRNLLKAVMDEKAKGKLNVEIAFVFCNWDNTEEDNPRKDQRDMFFEMVRGYDIPLVKSSWKKFRPELRKNDEDKWRIEYGKLLRQKTG
ncbi:MAG TPA: phosphoribosylglycinamide formyltransferase, partial [Candidatus Methanomethylophilaceae archaeon]|nr:phosphoribosylglycinamide formyltransferase [Candidatus Methanomethylophilaceae archaeon]